MTTPHSTAWLRRRIEQATTMADLRTEWDNMAFHYKRQPEIMAAKNKRKEELRK